MKLLVYDCETECAIPDQEPRRPGIRYCQGWGDHAGMGISVLCAYEWGEGYRVFLADNLWEFKALAEHPKVVLIGFGNRGFDDRLIQAQLGVEVPLERSFDLCEEVVKASGTKRPKLSALCGANFLTPKTMDGSMAPVLWQQGKRGQVVDYCLGDVLRLKKLIELVYLERLRCAFSGRRLTLDLSKLISKGSPL